VRANQPGRIGVVFAAIALLLQIAGPSLHPPRLLGSANGAPDFSIAFDEHALCLARNSGDSGSETPADKAPKPRDHDFAACCVWHAAAGAVLAPAALVEPVAFAASRIAFTAPLADIPTRLPGTVRARAPPLRA
jgi:hypothetical protein